MNLGPNVFFVSDKEGVYEFFKTGSIIPFGLLIKLGTDSFFVTNKAEVLIEIVCCSARHLFLNIIDILVSVFFTIDDDDDDDDNDNDNDNDNDDDNDNDNDDDKDDCDRFCLKTRSKISFGWLIKLGWYIILFFLPEAA